MAEIELYTRPEPVDIRAHAKAVRNRIEMAGRRRVAVFPVLPVELAPLPPPPLALPEPPRWPLSKDTAALNMVGPIVGPILLAACDEFDVSPSDIRDMSRVSKIIRARQTCAFVAVQMTRLSLSEIGRRLGKDHSTICHNIKRVRRRMNDEDGFALSVGRTWRSAFERKKEAWS